MKTSKTIAVVGATGRLALPVIQQMLWHGYRVKAVVRNPEKAKKMLPASVDSLPGDVSDPISLMAAFKGVDYVYINLSSDDVSPNRSFYAEREGIQNIVNACQLTGIQHILKISALGAYPFVEHDKDILQNQIRRQGHVFIEQSGIPFTIFHPTWFLDSIFWGIKKDTLQWIGKPTGFYWINSVDYAVQVIEAIDNPKAFDTHYAVQGSEKMDYLQIIERLKVSFNPRLKMQVLPVWSVRLLGTFLPKMAHLAELFSFYENTKEEFLAQKTWEDLGKPRTSLEEFALQFKEEKSLYL
ncbi:MAG: NAD(P)H-binding protein [Spirosomataceae bacterium]